METENQIKSKKRVQDHGEVYTNPREVNAMLDLVKHETERIESRFLEPACGNGNFLIEILNRKLAVVTKRYAPNKHRSNDQWERYALLALSSMYGVEILLDNAIECRERLFDRFMEEYQRVCKETNQDVERSARYLLDCNIVCGDALTLRTNQGEPIVFAQWDLVNSHQVKRQDYTLAHLLEIQEELVSLFMHDLEYDQATKTFIPKPIREYPPINFWEVYKYEPAV